MNKINIRYATIEDAREITLMHIESWKTTYRGIFPDEWLDKTPETIAKNIENRVKRIHDDNESGWPNIVAEIDGQIVGWAAGGNNKNPEYPFAVDLNALYLLKEFQNQGIGKMLVKAFVELALKNGYNSMIIWALEENHQARKFYQKLGGKEVGNMLFMDKYPEIGYGFENINKIIERN